MTVKEWCDLNQEICKYNNFYIKVFSKPSLKSDDIEIQAKVTLDTMKKYFGSLTIYRIRTEWIPSYDNDSISCFEFLLWPFFPEK